MSIEAMKQALDALEAELSEVWTCNSYHPSIYPAMEALRTAIQQAESEPVAVRNPFAARCYTMSESHLSGHRLIVGFEKLEDAQAAHEWVARCGRGDSTHPAPGVWVDAAERVPLESDGEVFVRFTDGSIGTAWATYWHGASNAFAQWTHPDPDEDRTIAHWMKAPALAASPAQKGPDHGDPRQKAVPDPA